MPANHLHPQGELSIHVVAREPKAERVIRALRSDGDESDSSTRVEGVSDVAGLDTVDRPPDAVVVDLTDADNGFQRLDAASDRSPDVPIVAIVDSPEAGARAVEHGVREYFVLDDVDDATFSRSVRHAITQAADGNGADGALSVFDDLTRKVLAADTVDDVCELTADACRTGFGFPFASVVLYDDDSGRFQPVVASDVFADDSPLLESGTGPVWEAFATGDGARIDDLADHVNDHDGSLRSCLLAPVGRHGVVVVGADEPNYFSDADERVISLLSATLDSAFGHLDREATLGERDREIDRKDETLARVERTNDVVRNLVRSVTRASTRDELEQAVCSRLGNAEAYRLGWIGEHDGGSGEVTVSTVAGTEADYLDDVSLVTAETETPEPAVKAILTEEMQVEETLRTDPPFESWRREALRRGFRSVLAIPLIYKDSHYGVLALYADRPNEFGEAEREVFSEIGSLVAYAINAIERKRALVGDNAIELEFGIGDPSLPQIQLLQATNSSAFEFESVVPNPDGTLRVFFTIRGDDLDLERAYEFAEQTLIVEDYSLISAEENELQFECTLIDPNIISTMLDHGAVPKKLAADGNTARLTVEVPQSADVRRFATMVQTKYENTELIARRKRDRPIQTQQEFMVRLEEHLTDRQSEAVRTAFYSGFFEWPRESTGEEIAERMGVSQPTFTRHLRSAERNLLTVLFEGPSE